MDVSKEILNERELRATPIRMKLIEFILEKGAAVPYSSIRKEFEESDRITLYRTLRVLLEKGIIHVALENKDEIYYALCDRKCSSEAHEHDHVHFQCSNCNSVTCEPLDHHFTIPMKNFRIEKININMTGLCKECNLQIDRIGE